MCAAGRTECAWCRAVVTRSCAAVRPVRIDCAIVKLCHLIISSAADAIQTCIAIFVCVRWFIVMNGWTSGSNIEWKTNSAKLQFPQEQKKKSNSDIRYEICQRANNRDRWQIVGLDISEILCDLRSITALTDDCSKTGARVFRNANTQYNLPYRLFASMSVLSVFYIQQSAHQLTRTYCA